jgi:hypothetical protein
MMSKRVPVQESVNHCRDRGLGGSSGVVRITDRGAGVRSGKHQEIIDSSAGCKD